MKNNITIKKILATALMCLLMLQVSFGASISVNQAASSTNSLITAAGTIQQITLANGTGTALNVRILDAPSTTLTYTVGAYTNYVPTIRTNTVTYTDILGGTVSNSYLFVTNVATTVAAATNNYRTVAFVAVPANTTVTIPYESASPFVFGLLITNNSVVSGTIDYNPLR